MKESNFRVPIVLQFWSKSDGGDFLEGTSVVSLAHLLKVLVNIFVYLIWHICIFCFGRCYGLSNIRLHRVSYSTKLVKLKLNIINL